MYVAYFVATSCLIRKDRATSAPRHDFVTHQLQKKHRCRLAGYCGAIRSSDARASIWSTTTCRQQRLVAKAILLDIQGGDYHA